MTIYKNFISKCRKKWYFILEKIVYIQFSCRKNFSEKEDVSMDVLDLAHDIVVYLDQRGSSISNLKLQKTLYYIQGYCLKVHAQPAFPNSILHWAYGPVVADAYYEYSVYGAEPIVSGSAAASGNTLFNGFERGMVDTIEKVINACNARSASQLVEQTHQENPWKKTVRNQEITLQSIAAYFSKNDPLQLNIGR